MASKRMPRYEVRHGPCGGYAQRCIPAAVRESHGLRDIKPTNAQAIGRVARGSPLQSIRLVAGGRRMDRGKSDLTGRESVEVAGEGDGAKGAAGGVSCVVAAGCVGVPVYAEGQRGVAGHGLCPERSGG